MDCMKCSPGDHGMIIVISDFWNLQSPAEGRPSNIEQQELVWREFESRGTWREKKSAISREKKNIFFLRIADSISPVMAFSSLSKALVIGLSVVNLNQGKRLLIYIDKGI